MSPEIVTILVLVAMFVVATVVPVNMGAIAFAAAFVVGTTVAGLSTDDIIGGFPGDIFLVLVGLTYMFAIAEVNGTIDLVVRAAMRSVRGHLAAIPWIFFLLTALLSAMGALFAVAIVAPLAMPFARRYGVNLLLMGMMVVHGALAGVFSPITVYGGIVSGILAQNNLPSSPLTLFLAPLVVNVLVAVLVFATLGGRRLIGVRADAAPDSETAPEPVPAGAGPAATTADSAAVAEPTEPIGGTGVSAHQVLTLVGILGLAVGIVVFGLDPGFLSIAIAVLLALAAPHVSRGAVAKISWSTVLLICGVLTYIEVLREVGTVEYVGAAIAGLGTALLAALLLCYLGGVTSAFASSTAILGVVIPLAVPFLARGDIGVIGMVAALAVASTIVDVSPFSTNGALVLANTPADVDRDAFYRQMLAYSGVVVTVGPALAWLVLVVPGWL